MRRGLIRLSLAACALAAFLVAAEVIEGEALGGRLGGAVYSLASSILPAVWARYAVAAGLLASAVGIAAAVLASRSPQSPSAAIRRKLAAKALFHALALSVILAAIGGMVLYLEERELTRAAAAQIAFAGLLSGAVGFGELISRYRDDPRRLLASAPTAIYVCVNMAAGVAALALVGRFDVFPAGDNKMLYEVLLASFGAIAFFRTSFFTARIGDADVGIGPSTLLKSLLDSSGTMTDREQAVTRGGTVAVIMPNIDFEKAKAALPTLCFTLVEGLSPDQQRAVGEQIAKLSADPGMSPDAKAKILGVYLVRQVGSPVLAQAIETLGDQITKTDPAGSGPASRDGPSMTRDAAAAMPGVDPSSGTRGTRAATWARGLAAAAWHSATSPPGPTHRGPMPAPAAPDTIATDPHGTSPSDAPGPRAAGTEAVVARRPGTGTDAAADAGTSSGQAAGDGPGR